MKKLWVGLVAVVAAVLIGIGLRSCPVAVSTEVEAEKPVLYLYPEEETGVSVKLDYVGELTVTYPAYEDGWNMTAYPDGTLLDAEGNEYSYLFWEGVSLSLIHI